MGIFTPVHIKNLMNARDTSAHSELCSVDYGWPCLNTFIYFLSLICRRKTIEILFV